MEAVDRMEVNGRSNLYLGSTALCNGLARKGIVTDEKMRHWQVAVGKREQPFTAESGELVLT